MPDYIGEVAGHWIQYVFGSALIGGIVIMFFIALWGLKRNWSLDMYIVVCIPIIFLMTTNAFGNVFEPGIIAIVLVLAGIIIALGLIKLSR